MDALLNILIVEDSLADYRLLVRHIQQQEMAANCHRVATLEDLKAVVEKSHWDIILSDYNVPGMDFLETLGFLQKQRLDVPIILVSGSLGEEKAVDLLKMGVGDFILKNNLTRLAPAVRREVREAEVRRQRHLAEEARRRYEMAVEQSSDGIAFADLEGRLISVNKAWAQMHGYELADMIGQHLSINHTPEQMKSDVVPFNDIVLKKGEYQGEVGHRRKDGTTVPTWMTTAVLRDNKGNPVGLVGTAHNITEQKRIEQERLRLIAAMEQTNDTILITDSAGAIQYVNPAFEKTSGHLRQAVLGQNPRILKSGKQNAEFYRQMWAVITRGEVWRGRFINRHKDGKVYEEDASITPICDDAGKIVNYVAVMRDVTHEVAMEAQLRQAQKMEAIGTLAGGVAHEINNPINGIMNYAQVITDELPADSHLQQFAANIIKETNRVSQIVRNLLSFARQNPQERSPAYLSDIIKSVLTLVQSVIRHDQITLTVEVPEGLPQMECHSQQIEQVLLNLLTNARDALNEKYPAYHEDKIIRVTARQFEREGTHWIQTSVEDHANGIPEEARDRIFDPFFTTKPVDKGTGLGLSISHGIVKNHDGELHFESESGRGTRFHMDLPVKG